jgi:hypothetical protein
MGPIFSWLFGNHALGLGWVLFFATWVGFVVLLMFGKKTDEQEREIHELLQESQEVNAENARIREENHFEDLYAWLFRGEVPPASPRRKRGIPWLNG